ncbi:unnamed protein product, partial [Discosporangium mesarthrocarpum]
IPSSSRSHISRGGKGVIALKFKAPSGKKAGKDQQQLEDDSLACFRVVTEEDEVMLSTAHGNIVRQRVDAVTLQSRLATGVRVQRLDGGDTIADVAVVPIEDVTGEGHEGEAAVEIGGGRAAGS